MSGCARACRSAYRNCVLSSSHIVSDPRAFSAALYAFQFVVRYLLRGLFFLSVTQSVYGRQHGDLCNKAEARDSAFVGFGGRG